MIFITELTKDSSGILHESENIAQNILGPDKAERLSLDEAEDYLTDNLGYLRAHWTHKARGRCLEHPATRTILSITATKHGRDEPNRQDGERMHCEHCARHDVSSMATVTAQWVDADGHCDGEHYHICAECLRVGDPSGPGYRRVE